MSLTEFVVQGTLKSDGTIELDRNPGLAPGRVTVVLRQETELPLPQDDPFWQRMQAMWDRQSSCTAKSNCAVDTEEELRRMRDEWEEHQQEIERLQREGRAARHAQEGLKS